MPEIVEAIRAKRARDRRPDPERRLRRHLGAGVPGQGSRRWRSSRTSGTCRPQSRAAAEPALFRLVQAAWQLDAVGDTGNRAEVEPAYPPVRRGRGRVRRTRSRHAVSHAGAFAADRRRAARWPLVGMASADRRRTSRSRRRSRSTKTCCRSPPARCGACHAPDGVGADVAASPTTRRCRGANRCGSSWSPATCRRGRRVGRPAASATRRAADRARAERAADVGHRRHAARRSRRRRRDSRLRRWPLGAAGRTLALPAMDLPLTSRAPTKESGAAACTALAAGALAAVDFAARHTVGRAQRPDLDARAGRRGRRRRDAARAVGARRPAGAAARWSGVAGRAGYGARGAHRLPQAVGSRARAGVRREHARAVLRRRPPRTPVAATLEPCRCAARHDARRRSSPRTWPTRASARAVAGAGAWPAPRCASRRVTPAGARAPPGDLDARAGWERRYWLKQPLELARWHTAGGHARRGRRHRRRARRRARRCSAWTCSPRQ